MKIVIHRDKCIGAGQCVSAAPELFDQDEDDGIAILLKDSPSPDQEEDARTAMHLCPAMAVEIEE